MEKYAAITFDIERFPKPGNMSSREADLWSDKGFHNLIEFLHKREGEFTFFVNGEFLEKSTVKLEKLDPRFEIAAHGYFHTDRFHTLEQASRDIERITNLLHSHGVHPKGYKFPKMKFDPSLIKILSNFNYQYDGSLHPTFVPFKYNHFLKPRTAFYVESVLEIPTTVTSPLRLPLSWFWFRNYPELLRSRLTRSLADEEYIVLYFHNFDLINLPSSANFFLRRKGDIFDTMLSEFFEELTSYGFRFVSMFELYKKLKKDLVVPPPLTVSDF